MNGSTEHHASDASEKAGRPPVVLNLGTARRMLPLVRKIVADIWRYQRLLDQLGTEQEQLDEHRRILSWPQRHRRYQVHEEYAAAAHEHAEALIELEVLGVTLVDGQEGRVGLPTVVNGRLAYFSWKPGESSVQFWHFPAESARRSIPAHWSENAPVPLKSNS